MQKERLVFQAAIACRRKNIKQKDNPRMFTEVLREYTEFHVIELQTLKLKCCKRSKNEPYTEDQMCSV